MNYFTGLGDVGLYIALGKNVWHSKCLKWDACEINVMLLAH